MSEQINKVLADRPQSFTTAEQLQARINIGAQAAGDYAYNSAVSGVIDTVSSHSATWEQGGIDSATVSAIASSYAESAASSKLDASASSQFYPTSNPSSFVDSSYVDGAVSGKADASSLTAYAFSSDVSGVIDTVSANSANWADNGIDSATCSAIASSYAESAVSSKLDASASSQFYLTSNPSAFISGVSHDLNLSGNGRTTQLGLAKKINIVDEYGNSAHLDPEAFSLIGDNSTPVFSADGHGVYVSGVAGNASSPYVTEYGLQGLSINGTDTYHGITATATFRYSGATLREGGNSALLKPTGLTLHTTAGDEVCDASSIVRWNSYSGKADGSSMSSYALSSDVSGVIDTVSANSASWGQGSVDHDSTLTGDGTSAQPLGVNGRELVFDSSMRTSVSGNSAIVGVDTGIIHSFTGCSANNCITGDGTSGSPLGLSGQIRLEDSNSALELQPNYILVNNNAGSSQIGNAYVSLTNPLNGGSTAHLADSALTFTNSSNHTAQVDISSIDRWNSNVWNESGNSVSTGIGGNPVTAASQYNYSGNWAGRTVKMSGLPDQTMYGFQARPNGTATIYGVNAAGAFLPIPQANYYTYLFHVTGSAVHTFEYEIYPTGLTANARLDFVNLCSAASANVMTDTFHGSTSILNPGQSATMWYIATADTWTDGGVPVPV